MHYNAGIMGTNCQIYFIMIIFVKNAYWKKNVFLWGVRYHSEGFALKHWCACCCFFFRVSFALNTNSSHGAPHPGCPQSRCARSPAVPVLQLCCPAASSGACIRHRYLEKSLCCGGDQKPLPNIRWWWWIFQETYLLPGRIWTKRRG